MDIRNKVIAIRKNIPSAVSIMAVTKQRTLDEIQKAIDAGVTIIGENYVQEALDKYPQLHQVEKHFIGHLQRNKVGKALSVFDWIDSVDSIELAKEISKKAVKPVSVLVQVNAGSEEQKNGVHPSQALQLIKEMSALPHVEVKGLQIVTPIPSKPEDSRPYFREMKQLFDLIASEKIPNVSMEVLSMGMSADYLVSLSEGSTMVRIGEGIFGARKT